MKTYLWHLKNIWTNWVWYAWIAFMAVVSWPVPSWILFILVTVGFSFVLPVFALVDNHYKKLDGE